MPNQFPGGISTTSQFTISKGMILIPIITNMLLIGPMKDILGMFELVKNAKEPRLLDTIKPF